MRKPAGGKIFEPRYGLHGIEQRAIACLERCRSKLKLKTIPLPIPIEQFIEGPLEIQFGITDLSHLGEDVLGAVFIKDREIMVSENAMSNEGRFRFTCAHELGHLTLHQNVAKEFREVYSEDPDAASLYEKQADRFAAAFLMPIPLLEQELFRICRDQKLEWRACIVELMVPTPESEFLWRKRFLPVLTKRFAVSYTAALIRFENIRLKGGDQRPLLPPTIGKRLRERPDPEKTKVAVKIVNGKPVRYPVMKQGSLFEPTS